MKRNKKEQRRVNATVRALNKQIREDVFGDRFSIRQIERRRGELSGMYFYTFILEDKESDHVMHSYWESACGICEFNHLHRLMNDFIVESNFWDNYFKNFNPEI